MRIRSQMVSGWLAVVPITGNAGPRRPLIPPLAQVTRARSSYQPLSITAGWISSLRSIDKQTHPAVTARCSRVGAGQHRCGPAAFYLALEGRDLG